MKKVLITISLMSLGLNAFSQLLATVQMNEHIEGICNDKKVFSLYSGFKGQVEPKYPLQKDEVQSLLNEKVKFIKDNLKFKGKGMIGVYINCKGDALNWEISTSTKSSELDQQILSVFKTLSKWTPGTLHGEDVDTRVLITYKIKKGVIVVDLL
jgi:hypothetical protein